MKQSWQQYFRFAFPNAENDLPQARHVKSYTAFRLTSSGWVFHHLSRQTSEQNLRGLRPGVCVIGLPQEGQTVELLLLPIPAGHFVFVLLTVNAEATPPRPFRLQNSLTLSFDNPVAFAIAV